MLLTTPKDGPILFYDGSCGFCSATVQWIIRRDQRGVLRFAALDSATARRALPADIRDHDSMIWLDEAGLAERSDAALRVARYLGGGWRVLATAGYLVPRPLRDAVYRWIARHRHQLIGAAHCIVPSSSERQRFLD